MNSLNLQKIDTTTVAILVINFKILTVVMFETLISHQIHHTLLGMYSLLYKTVSGSQCGVFQKVFLDFLLSCSLMLNCYSRHRLEFLHQFKILILQLNLRIHFVAGQATIRVSISLNSQKASYTRISQPQHFSI